MDSGKERETRRGAEREAMTRHRTLGIEPPADLEPPPDRGPLLTPEEVAQDPDLFRGKVKAQWVRRNVRPKVVLGHSTVLYYRDDVRDWIEGRRRP
jgi:hypothetical protein